MQPIEAVVDLGPDPHDLTDDPGFTSLADDAARRLGKAVKQVAAGCEAAAR